MSRKSLFILWAVLFGLCAALGFLPEPEGPLGTALTVLSVFSFLPPALLIHQAGKQADRHTLLLIRNLSALSLGLTLVLTLPFAPSQSNCLYQSVYISVGGIRDLEVLRIFKLHQRSVR